MKTNEKWIVTAAHLRREGDKCKFCFSNLDEEHKVECDFRERTIVVCYVITTIRRVKESSDINEIESQMNEFGSCKTNLLDELDLIYSGARCMCDDLTGKYMREATSRDELIWNTSINEINKKSNEDSKLVHQLTESFYISRE